MSKAVDAAADLLLVADEIRNDALWPIPILEVLPRSEAGRTCGYRPTDGPKWQIKKGQQCGYGMDFSSVAQDRRRFGHSEQLPCGNSSCPTATARFAGATVGTVVRSAITRSSFPKCSLESREIFRSEMIFPFVTSFRVFS